MLCWRERSLAERTGGIRAEYKINTYYYPCYGEAIADVREAASSWSMAVLTNSGICAQVTRAQRTPCGKSMLWVAGTKMGTQKERGRQGKEVLLELRCNPDDEGKRKSTRRWIESC